MVTNPGDCIDTSNVFVVTGGLGISDSRLSLGAIRVYPNPAVDKLYIRAAETLTVQLCSVEGRVLMNMPAARVIDVSSLAGGLYLLRFSDAGGNCIGTKRFTRLSQD